jgi:hypothetical protein
MKSSKRLPRSLEKEGDAYWQRIDCNLDVGFSVFIHVSPIIPLGLSETNQKEGDKNVSSR